MSDATLLIADDDRSIRDAYEMVMRKEGYNVCLAEDGESVISTVIKLPIHLVLLDFHMPRMDGLETLREIKKINPALPVIMTSGLADEEDVRNFLENGALSFLRKPIEIKTLRSYIRDILKGPSRGVIIVRRMTTSISIRYKL